MQKVTKVANYREKGKEKEEGEDLTMSMPMMFHGVNREGEMSAMVSALTHVICGDDGSSVLKRRREDDESNANISPIKHQG